MKIIVKDINDVIPYDNNPRKNDEAVEYVANSIAEFGWQQPIVIDTENVIIAGHTRYKAAVHLGLNEIPCVVAENLTDEQVRAYRLADNKTAELAEWDEELLNIEFENIYELDMEDFGFTFDVEEEKAEERESVDISEGYEIIIDCETETECQELYEKLMEMNIECRISTL